MSKHITVVVILAGVNQDHVQLIHCTTTLL